MLVPTSDHQKEASLSYLVEKLVTELRRVRDRNRVDLQLEDEIMRLFFREKGDVTITDKQLEEVENILKAKYNSMGNWTESHPFMMNAFLQDYFTLNSVIDESASIRLKQEEHINLMTAQL